MEDDDLDAAAREEEEFLASFPPQYRPLVAMIIDRMCEADIDSTYRPHLPEWDDA